MSPYDVIVIGGGHNALIAAAFLAHAGLKTLVLERMDRVGGCARTSEIAPGFRCPTLAHTAAIDPAIIRTLGLERHGLRIIRPESNACAPTADGRALVLWADARQAVDEIRAFSSRDADQYPRFLASFAAIARVLRRVCETAPPVLDDPTVADLIELLKAGRAFRALGKADAYRLLRWMPMAVADLAGEWFESEPLRATVAAGGITGSFLGPWSAGSSAILLLLGAGEGHPIATGWFAAGGPGALADALGAAARSSGAEIRTGAAVARIDVMDETATGVTLTTGEQIPARAVVSGADPKRTLLGLVDPVHLAPDFIRRVQNIRAHGTLAKVNYAVSALPSFTGLSARDANQHTGALSGRVRLATDIDAIERAFDAAKYGGFADEPWIELVIPSIGDLSLAPKGQHVVSAYVQYAPYHLKTSESVGGRQVQSRSRLKPPTATEPEIGWDVQRDRLGDATTRTIARYAPGFSSTIVAREVITPLDLERSYGLTGGHVFHGELGLDQCFVARPLLGWARYNTPVRRLYLCGAGTHPGTGLNGRSGALAGRTIARDLKRP